MLAPRRPNLPRRQGSSRPPTADRAWPGQYGRGQRAADDVDRRSPGPATEDERDRREGAAYHLHQHYHDRRGQLGAGTGFATGFGFALGMMAARLLVILVMIGLLVWAFYALLDRAGLTGLF